MTRSCFRLCKILLLAATCCGGISAARAEILGSLHESVEDVAHVLQRASNGSEWRSYLRFDELRDEIAKGEIANASTLRQTIARLQADSPYLARPEFVSLRQELTAVLAKSVAPVAATPPPPAELAFVKPNPQILATAEKGFRDALANFDRFLATAPDRGLEWKKYLGLVADGQAVDMEKIDWLSLANRLTADRHGRRIHSPAFVGLRQAVTAYSPLQLASQENVAADFQEHINQLAAALQAYPNEQSPDARRTLTAKIGNQVQWLEDRAQAGSLVANVRQQWSHPNLYVLASEYVVSAGMERQVNEPTAIHENILGTDVHGSGTTIGSSRARLVPNKEQATFDLLSYGTTYSNTVGYNSGATIHSRSTLTFNGSKRIYAMPDGMWTSNAVAQGHTNSNPYSVSSGRGHGGIITRIANNVAWGRVQDSKHAAEVEGTRKATIKVQARMDEEAAKQIADSNRRFDQDYRAPMTKADAYPGIFRYSTTAYYVQAMLLQARRSELGAPSRSPPIKASFDFAIQIHESMLENYYRAIYGGKLRTEAEMRKDFSRYMNADDFKARFPEDEQGEGTITFDEQLPLFVRFTDNGYIVTVRGQRFQFSEEGNPVNAVADMIAEYEFGDDAEGYTVARRTRMEIESNAAGQAKRRLEESLMGNASRIFQETERFDPLLLSGNWSKAGKLKLNYRHAENGWLVISWIRPAFYQKKP